MQHPNERFVRSSVMIMLLLGLFSSLCATLIHWLEPAPQPLDLIIPPTMSVIFTGLLITLQRRPEWLFGVTQAALLSSVSALIIPTWYYLWRVETVSGLTLVAIFPPISSLLLVLMVLTMLLLPARHALFVALFGWSLIAIPILIYLFTHPAEMWSPRGKDLMMTYGPGLMVLLVLIPFQRGLNRKIEELVSERAQMQNMADRDPLTRVYNRRPSERMLQDIFVGDKPAGVILFDLDRFKAVNDKHGHVVGDQVLQTVAERCCAVIRKGGHLFRWGGEEFLVVLPHVDEPGLQQVAERLRLAIAQSAIEPAGQVTASFGITPVQPGDNLASLLERVDQALYQAKHQGRNCVVLVRPGTEDEPATEQLTPFDTLEQSNF